MRPSRETTEGDPDWVTHVCPRCQREFRGRADEIASAACPRCRVVLDPSIPVDVKRDASRRHVRMKIRREKIEVETEEPTWEHDEDAGDTREAIAEFIQVDPNTEDGLRLTRVSKRRIPSLFAKLGRAGTVALVAAVLAATGIVVALLIFRSVKVAQQDVAEFRKPVESRDIDAEVASVVVTPSEQRTCLALLDRFLDTPRTEEKLELVRVPDRVRPWIAQSSGDSGLKGGKKVAFTSKSDIEERTFLLLAVELEAEDVEERHRFLAFEKTDEGAILLDWEVTFRHRQIPLSTFKRTKPRDPAPFRVRVARSSEVAPRAFDDERFVGVDLSFPGDRSFHLVGFIDRDTPWGAALLARLEFEKPHVILDLRYPENAVSDAHVEVTEVVRNSWYY